MEPMPEAVAGPEPEIAEKIAQATTLMWRRLPGIRLPHFISPRKKFLLRPLATITSPISINTGTAERVKSIAAFQVIVPNVEKYLNPSETKSAARPEMPRQMAIQVPGIIRAKRSIAINTK